MSFIEDAKQYVVDTEQEIVNLNRDIAARDQRIAELEELLSKASDTLNLYAKEHYGCDDPLAKRINFKLADRDSN